jgi:hypothetical protein
MPIKLPELRQFDLLGVATIKTNIDRPGKIVRDIEFLGDRSGAGSVPRNGKARHHRKNVLSSTAKIEVYAGQPYFPWSFKQHRPPGAISEKRRKRWV